MASVKYAVILLGFWVRICGCTLLGAHDWTLSVARSSSGTVLEGSNVTFTCTVQSGNQYSVWIEWQHSLDGKTTTLDTKPTYAEGSHNLTLTGVSGYQVGSYRCAGSISWSSGYWNPSTVSDWSPLLLHYHPVIINEDRTWIGANDKDTATLECIIRSSPVATVTWINPTGINVTNNTDPDRVSLDDRIEFDADVGYLIISQLIINPVEVSTDYGMYRCRAANGIGTFDDHEIQLKETGKPGPPTDLREYHVSETSIWFKWEAGYDGGENLRYYSANVRKISQLFDPSNWDHPQYQAWSYNDVTGDTLYEIAVFASNERGDGQAATLQVRTTPSTPPDLGITVVYTKSIGRFVITGIPSDDDNGTCLRLLNVYSFGETSLRPDLDCIQRDSELVYVGSYSELQCCYCRDGLCSSNSNVKFVWELTVAKYPSNPIQEGGVYTFVRLTCNVHSPVSGWVEWRYSTDRETWTTLTKPTYTEGMGRNSLLLEMLLRDQSGWYRCAGNDSDSEGSPEYWNTNQMSEWTDVVVYYGPEIANNSATSVSADDNQVATLECIFRGDPLPIVHWYFANGTVITADTFPNRVSLEDTISGDGAFGYQVISHLVFAPVQASTDFGIYRCSATNNIGTGSDHHEIQLEEREKMYDPTVVIIAVCVPVGIILLLATGAVYFYYRKRISGAKTDPQDELIRTGQPNPAVEVFDSSQDTPSTNVQAVGLDVNVNDDAPQATDENEEQV